MSKINYTRLIKYAAGGGGGGGSSIDSGVSPSRLIIKPWDTAYGKAVPSYEPEVKDTPTDEKRDTSNDKKNPPPTDPVVSNSELIDPKTGELNVEAINQKFGMDYFGTVTQEQFIKDFSPIVTIAVQGTNILPATALTQFILEQGIGDRERFGGKSAAGITKGFNIGNVKTYGHYKGGYGSYGHNDDDPSDRFIKFPNIVEGIKGYTGFLMDNSNYKRSGVFEAKTTPEQLTAIMAAGYSTHPQALDNLLNIYKNNFSSAKLAGGVANRITEFRRGGLILYKNYKQV